MTSCDDDIVEYLLQARSAALHREQSEMRKKTATAMIKRMSETSVSPTSTFDVSFLSASEMLRLAKRSGTIVSPSGEWLPYHEPSQPSASDVIDALGVPKCRSPPKATPIAQKAQSDTAKSSPKRKAKFLTPRPTKPHPPVSTPIANVTRPQAPPAKKTKVAPTEPTPPDLILYTISAEDDEVIQQKLEIGTRWITENAATSDSGLLKYKMNIVALYTKMLEYAGANDNKVPMYVFKMATSNLLITELEAPVADDAIAREVAKMMAML